MSRAEVVDWARGLCDDLEFGAVRAWLAEAPKRKAAGYLPVYAPREVIHGCGLLPVGIHGAGDQLEIIRGDAFYQSYICHIPRSVVELAQSGRLDILAAVLFVLDCALSEVAAGAEFGNQLDQAAAALDARAGRPWLDLEPAAQVAAMRDIEKTPFFVAIQNAMRAGIYNDPAFWKHIGYAGPSKAFGGYLHRGAGEIDWLPGKLP